MTLTQYLENISKRYKLGNATEHSYRGDLQQLIESIVPGIAATNEPQRQSCGAPDYIITRKEIPIGFIEAKDIGDNDLDGVKKTGNKEQFDRYKASLSNLIFTDYLNFHLYRDGQLVMKVVIGELKDGKIIPSLQSFDTFIRMIQDFCVHISQTIKSPKKLAEMMAGKAKLLADIIGKALTSDVTNHENSTLKEQMHAFRELLIHDITPKGFADVYAQTIAYGMFAARLHDPTLPTFSRQEAAELIPKSNPFLRKLFGYIAGPDLDDRIKWIVDSLVDIFLASNVGEILMNYGKTTKTEDPIIHFYETFLSAYDPKLRKARGVWYTPYPVVNFIVRAVDDILKTQFDLPQGLTDTSKIRIKFDHQGKKAEKEMHRVQILDPAAGTGTFLAEVIRQIYVKFEGQEGIWSNYVENHLLPRLNGFEILMASYAMAHLKLDLLLTETGYKPSDDQRFKVYLTNSLEEYHPDTGTIFTTWLSAEANEANRIKRDTPVMVVIGNPPYSGESSNKGEWIMKLMEDYKKEPGGIQKLKEKNFKFINDDYVKFLRYGQDFIENNGSGILGFINPHGFLDNPTFRGMRWNLLKTYDRIYTIDLHGNAKKNEIAPNGESDINIFDIEQGVSINFFIKTGEKNNNELGKVFHFDLYGKREVKYDFLIKNNLKSVPYINIENISPNYFFKPKDFLEEKSFDKGFSITELFPLNSLGLLTKKDDLSIDFDAIGLENKIEYFLDPKNTTEEVCKRFKLVIKDKDKWDANQTRNNVSNTNIKGQIRNLQYRPFDNRKVFYNPFFVARPNSKVLGHFNKPNVGLIVCRQGQAVGGDEWNVVFICKYFTDQNIYRRGGGTVFPLYLYSASNGLPFTGSSEERIPNFNLAIVNKVAKILDLPFTNEKKSTEGAFAPVDLLDYIYAILHSHTYREKYKEFLKTDFPRIPYPKDKKTFWHLVNLGNELRQIHLLESPVIEKYSTKYPIQGDNMVTKLKYQDTKAYINDQQYFSNVPEVAWNFFIGGYQPAQKWLKDRKGRKLEFEDVLHYQKIIVALMETSRIMSEIDQISFE